MTTKYITCGTLIDGTGAPPKPDMVLKLEDKRIASVAPKAATEIPPDADHLDLSAFTVLPGLVECEDHLSCDFNGGLDPHGGSPAYLAIKGVHYAHILLKAGITTCRDLHEPYGIDIAWKQAHAEGIMLGPRILTSCELLTKGESGSPWRIEVNTPSEMRETVRGLVEKGADVIKVSQTGAIQNSYDPNVQSDPEAPLRPRFTSEELRIMAREAHQSGVLITAHAHGGPSAGWLIEAGFDAIEHCTFFTREDLELMADRGTFLVATTGYLNLDPGTPEAEMFAFEKENFERALESCHRVYSMAREAGVKVAVGTDTKHGAIPGEIKFLVDCGWSPMEAIMAATKMGAECCGVPDAGTLEPGKFGDLIAVEGDPLQDLSVLETVHLVMLEGVVQNV